MHWDAVKYPRHVRMGVTVFATDNSMDIVRLAVEAEQRGFDSIWLPEHTHIPTSRITPPPTGDEVLAEEYRRTLDPLVALGAAASVTETIRLGTGIMLAAQREPIVTAKAIATLDMISAGRVSLGIGFGWNEDEMANHGVSMGERRDITREHILAMTSLWHGDVGSFDGEHVRITPSWSWPKPTQQPHPPLLLGGDGGPKLFAQIVEYANGWIPIGGSGLDKAIPRLHAAAEAGGRDPAELEVIPFGSIPTPGKLDHFRSLGVDECVFRLPSAPANEVLPVLDQWAQLLG